MRRLFAVVMVAGLVCAGTACDPAPTTAITITGRSVAECGDYIDMTGFVSPPTATPEVVLQRTVNGKWQDWLWYDTDNPTAKPHRIVAKVRQDSGSFYPTPRAPLSVGRTYSLRVRSKGGSVVSNTLWVTVQAPKSGGCPASMP